MTRLLTKLRKEGLSVPEPVEIPGSNGETVGRVTIDGDDGVAVRLFHYIEGELLERVPFVPGLLFELGIASAKLTTALSVSN